MLEKAWPHDSCDECGSDLVVRTDCAEGELVHDGDEAFCEECGEVVGTVTVEEDGGAWVNQFQERPSARESTSATTPAPHRSFDIQEHGQHSSENDL